MQIDGVRGVRGGRGGTICSTLVGMQNGEL